MKFNSKAGHELRTWILFVVGIGLVTFFAWQKNPLNPWWTLIIGAFTCTAVIVSAVQALVGGVTDAARKAIEEETERRRNDNGGDSEKQTPPSFSVNLGYRSIGFIRSLRRRNPVSIQPN